MSDAYIVRRGKIIQGGGGFDPNGAVLKVVTSTGCTVTVTGTGYSQTHQDSDGFPRSDDANVTEHFFSIPASAFGTITVKSTNTYGDNTKTVIVNTAGMAYEVLCGGKNIILNSAFGLQSGYVLDNNWSYSSFDKSIVLSNLQSYGTAIFKEYNPIRLDSLYSTLTVTARASSFINNKKITLDYYSDIERIQLSEIPLSTDLTSRSATISKRQYPNANLYGWCDLITEIILS